MAGCQSDKKQEQMTDTKSEAESKPAVSDEMMETAIIYEANIRQYSPEGTFAEFTKDIPELKKLEVKIIWLMPIYPISETKRKAKGDLFVSEIEDSLERRKYLGSYYAVSDFRKINPEYGTIEDFRKLLKTAHEHDMLVILDWVPNHTGWDHHWIESNPEFYSKNGNGDITDPLKPDGTPVGWADVADLNYDNRELRKAMLDDMMYWVKEEGVDGFRCDMAGMVPLNFWEETIPKLRSEKNLFMLAEAWEPQLMNNGMFDMAYGWDRHHTMNHIAKGEGKASAWDDTMNKDLERYKESDILMTFVTNHDENSWAGSVVERMGAGSKLFTALSYVAPGMPLIYSGQEYDLDHRLKFFEKDSIPKSKGEIWPLLEKLGELKSTHPALNGGKQAASYKRISANNDNVLYFERSKDGRILTFIGNLSGQVQTIVNPLKGEYKNLLSGDNEVYGKDEGDITLEPWAFKLLDR